MTELPIEELYRLGGVLHEARMAECYGNMQISSRKAWPATLKEFRRQYQTGQPWIDVAVAQAKSVIRERDSLAAQLREAEAKNKILADGEAQFSLVTEEYQATVDSQQSTIATLAAQLREAEAKHRMDARTIAAFKHLADEGDACEATLRSTIATLTAHVEGIRAATIEECAKAICPLCRVGAPDERGNHTSLKDGYANIPCGANAIRSARQPETGGTDNAGDYKAQATVDYPTPKPHGGTE